NGNDVQLLHTALAHLGLQVPEDERQRACFGQGTHDAIMRFQQEHRLAPTGIVDAETARAITQAVDASFVTLGGTVVSPKRTLSGRLTDATGCAAVGAAVRGIARDGGHELTVGETTTTADGAYSLSYRPLPTGSGLVVRALDATGHVLGESTPRFALA